MDMDDVKRCYWDSDGTCQHPRIGNSPAFEKRCSACTDFKRKVYHEVRVRPEETGDGKPGLFTKAVSYARAEASLAIKGPLDRDGYLLRLEVCNACPELDRAAEPDRLGWCRACTCPKWSRSELTVKGRMPDATCPRSKWNAESARAPLTEDLRGAINA